MPIDHKYTRIISKIASNQWAMEPRAFESMLLLLDEIQINPENFHRNPPEKIEALTERIGYGVEGTSYAYKRGRVGFLPIYGPIIPHADRFAENISGMVSIENLSNSFRALENDPSVEDIVLLLDTPGGAVTGVSEFANMVRESEKKTTAHIIGMAASAGYWIASAADRVTSTDTGIAGSIGVVMTVWNLDKAYEKAGINRFDIVSTQSPRKRTDLTTPEGRIEVHDLLDDIARVFIDSVAQGRGVPVETVESNFGKGAVVSAWEALFAGMIDEIVPTSVLFDDYFGIPRAQENQDGTVVQTLIFSKQNFTRDEAVKWAQDHDFRSDKVDETSTSWRLRQRDPGDFVRFRTIELDTGIKAVIGPLKKRTTAGATTATDTEASMSENTQEPKVEEKIESTEEPKNEAAPETEEKTPETAESEPAEPTEAELERERIKSIEAIEKIYSKHPPTVRKAVKETIDVNKFEANETAETVLAKVKDAVIAAQEEIIETTRKTRSQLGADLASVPNESDRTEPSNNSEAVDEKRVKNIAAGYNDAK